jgi:hypothetical protein
MSQIEENLTDDILEITSREELILLIKKLYNKLEQKKNTHRMAGRTYSKKHPEMMREKQKQYYDRKKQDPEWMANRSRKICERYHQKKNEQNNI